MSKLAPLALLACLFQPTAVDAQEFRIVTTIRDVSGKARTDAGVSTLTLFRHRKVYDYMADLGEVIIYEPAANQFTILNTRRGLATTVHFDEVKRLLKKRKPTIERYVAELRRNEDPIAENVAKAFQFQLAPTFEEAFDVKSNALTLRSENCVYRVKCAAVERSEQATQYLNYTDWMARLNSVLHPGAMFPEPRLALNNSLRRRGKFPQVVELQSNLDGKLHLKASHQIAFRLEETDRQRITNWEADLSSPRITKKSFEKYRQTILASR